MIQAARIEPPVSTLNAASLAKLFSVLSHEIRLEILELLAHGEQDVSTIADMLDLTVQAVSHHLSLLRKSGLVRPTRDKTRHIYSLTHCINCSVENHMVTTMIQDGTGVVVALSTCVKNSNR